MSIWWITTRKRNDTNAHEDSPSSGPLHQESCLDPLGLNVTDGAKVLGVARHTLSRVLNGQAGISAEMAIRLEKAGWSNAEVRRYEHQLPA